MAFVDDEKSINDSAPIELYEFVLPTITYRLTSGLSSITYAANVYTPATITRSSWPAGGMTVEDSISIDMDLKSALVKEFLKGVTPTSSIVTIYRYQSVSATAIAIWRGFVASVKVQGIQASLSIESSYTDALSSPTGVPLQRLCSHVLYDTSCGVPRGAGTATTISVSASGGRALTLSNVGGAVNDYFKFGEMVHVGTGEKRLVVSQVGLVVKLALPFPTTMTGAFTLFAGCDHQITTCVAKFANQRRFGGYPQLPNKNIFIKGFE